MKIHVARDFAMGGLNLYFVNDEGTRILTPHSVTNGVIAWQENDVEEGTVVDPTLRLSSVYAEAMIDGFRHYLSETQHIVTEKVYEREAARVDKMLDALIAQPPTVIDDRPRNAWES